MTDKDKEAKPVNTTTTSTTTTAAPTAGADASDKSEAATLEEAQRTGRPIPSPADEGPTSIPESDLVALAKRFGVDPAKVVGLEQKEALALIKEARDEQGIVEPQGQRSNPSWGDPSAPWTAGNTLANEEFAKDQRTRDAKAARKDADEADEKAKAAEQQAKDAEKREKAEART